MAEAFRGIPPVARHRLVYAAVDDLMKTDIHALAIEALAAAVQLAPSLRRSFDENWRDRAVKAKLPPPGASAIRP